MAVNIFELFKSDGLVNEKMWRTLVQSLVSNQEQGFDYLKFKAAVKTLNEMGLDVEKSIKSAFATAVTMGVSKESLMISIQHYRRVLEKEQKNFALALKNQIATNVDAKKLEFESLKNRLEENIKAIEKLERENEIIKKSLDNAQDEIGRAQAKIEKTRDDFKKTYDLINTLITDDENTIKKYIG